MFVEVRDIMNNRTKRIVALAVVTMMMVATFAGVISAFAGR